MSVKPFNRSTVKSSVRTTGSTIVVFNRQRTKKINQRFLKQIATALLAEVELEKTEIGISLVGFATEMTRLNETFLRHAGSTDVLAFDYSETGRAGSPLPAAGAHGVTRPAIYGEIFICVDEAVRQARRFGTGWQSEIVRYAVHGILHLLGFDDAKAGDRRRMKREEDRLLRRLARRFSLAQLSGPAKLAA